MKRIGVLAAAILLVAALCAIRLQAEAKVDDEAQIKALEERYVKAVRARDLDGIMACYVSDESLLVFDVLPPRQYVGAQAYKKDWQGFLSGFGGPITVEMSDLSITTAGKLGYGHNIQRVAGTDSSGKKIDITTRVTDGYRKVKGKWLISHEHVSVPVDLASGKADLTSKP
jgi:ketosteroid isomerase-like protein